MKTLKRWWFDDYGREDVVLPQYCPDDRLDMQPSDQPKKLIQDWQRQLLREHRQVLCVQAHAFNAQFNGGPDPAASLANYKLPYTPLSEFADQWWEDIQSRLDKAKAQRVRAFGRKRWFIKWVFGRRLPKTCDTRTDDYKLAAARRRRDERARRA